MLPLYIRTLNPKLFALAGPTFRLLLRGLVPPSLVRPEFRAGGTLNFRLEPVTLNFRLESSTLNFRLKIHLKLTLNSHLRALLKTNTKK